MSEFSETGAVARSLMQHVDVLIVGGGPAGSSCAWGLRGSGLDVVVMDRREFPRDKTCAGWITPPVLELLGIDTIDYQAGRTLQPITGFRTGLLGGQEIETRYDEVVSYGIRRCEFDHYLLDRCGARLLTGQPVQSIERVHNRWVVNGEINASALVGAGGHFCPVSRMLGTPSPVTPPLVTAQEIEFAADEQDLSRRTIGAETPLLLFCDDLGGYGWCFQKGRYLNIGLGHLDSRQMKADLQRLRTYLENEGRVTCRIPEKMHGHAYWLYDGCFRGVLEDGVLLIGDAAGLADARSGEGIRPAIESGLMAASVLSQCYGDYRKERLQPYAQWLTHRFGKSRGSKAGGAANVWRPRIGRALLRSRYFARHILLDRWFLHRHQTADGIPAAR